MTEFEEHRPRLRALAYRMLGSLSDADDAVQEAWLRLDRTDGVENPGGWLVNGTAGTVAVASGRLLSVMGFTVVRGRIVELDVLHDPDRLDRIVPAWAGPEAV